MSFKTQSDECGYVDSVTTWTGLFEGGNTWSFVTMIRLDDVSVDDRAILTAGVINTSQSLFVRTITAPAGAVEIVYNNTFANRQNTTGTLSTGTWYLLVVDCDGAGNDLASLTVRAFTFDGTKQFGETIQTAYTGAFAFERVMLFRRYNAFDEFDGEGAQTAYFTYQLSDDDCRSYMANPALFALSQAVNCTFYVPIWEASPGNLADWVNGGTTFYISNSAGREFTGHNPPVAIPVPGWDRTELAPVSGDVFLATAYSAGATFSTDLAVDVALSAAFAAGTTFTPVLSADRGLAAQFDAVSAFDAVLARDVGLAASFAALSAYNALLVADVALAVSVSSTTTYNAVLSVEGEVLLAVAFASSTTFTSVLTLDVGLAVSVASSAAYQAVLTVEEAAEVFLAVAFASTAAFDATLICDYALAVAFSAQTAFTAALEDLGLEGDLRVVVTEEVVFARVQSEVVQAVVRPEVIEVEVED